MSYFIFDTEAKAQTYGDAGPYPMAGTKPAKAQAVYPAVLPATLRWATPRKHTARSEWAIKKQRVTNRVSDPTDHLREDSYSTVETDENWFPTESSPS